MGALALALIGVMLGAAGAELLHAKDPELAKRIEDAAKRLIERLGRPAPGSDGPKQE